MNRETLEDLLKSVGAEIDAGEALRMAAAAAPVGRDAAAWTRLIAPDATAEQRDALDRLRRDARETLEDGLDGAPTPDALRARLNAVRDAMIARGFDGFLIPRADPHQGEETPRRDQRLAWATGFTGSAGLAILTRDACALFVDGRYTLQARMETDEQSVTIGSIGDGGASAWLRENAAKGARIAYDPWLHPPGALEALADACADADARLEPAGDNPVDAAWAGRAERPIAPVRRHADALAGDTADAKRHRMGAAIADAKADAAILTDPASIAWLLNIRGGDLAHTPVALAFAILRRDGRVDLFTDVPKWRAVADGLGADVHIHGWEAFGSALDQLREDAVLVDPKQAPDWIFQRLAAVEARVIHGDDPCLAAKAVKSEAEIAGMRACHHRDGVALCRFLAWLDAAGDGVTESEAAAKLEGYRAEDPDFLGPSFETIAGSGPNGAIVHYRVTPKTDRSLQPGELFLIDSGGQYRDGTTDVTRTVAIGQPTPEMRDRFTRVLKGHIALATLVFPKGASGGQIDAVARAPLWKAGLDYDHGTGHGVGAALGVHEGPARIAKTGRGPVIEAGMIFSNEPGFYKEGAFGIRIENLELVTEAEAQGADARPSLAMEALTLAPIDRRLIEPSLLSKEEMAWLDAYHARVREALGPRLEQTGDDRALRWLDDATAPLMSWWARPSPV